MSMDSKDSRSKAQLLEEIERLQFRLQEAEETLEAIRHAEVDALVVAGPQGEQVFSITGAEHIYRVIVETMNEAALTVDPDGTILFCNQRFCDLMKTSIQEVMGRKATAFAARSQQLSLRRLLAEAQTSPMQQHLLLRAADGTPVPVQLAASPLQTGDRTSICMVASDLTELEESAHSIRVLREHQQALAESEARFRTMFEASHDGIVITDDEGVCVQANPAVTAIFSLPPERLVGCKLSHFLDDPLDFPAFWRTLLANGSIRDELGLIDADGQRRDVDFYAVTSILPGRHMTVIRDITERKQAQQALEAMNERLQMQAEELEEQTEELRVQTEELAAANNALSQSEQRLRRFYDSGLVGVMYWNMDGTVTDANDKFLEMIGYTREELTRGRIDWMKITPPEYKERDKKSIAELIATGVNQVPFEKEYLRKDGTRLPVIIAGAMLDEVRHNGVAFVLDITERKRAEEALRQSEEQFHRLFEDDLTGDFISTPEGQILLCNPAFAKIFGFPAAVDAVGTSMLALYVDAAEREPLLERLKRQGKIERLQVWRKRRDGERIYIVENLVGHFNERGELYEVKGYVFDDTERKRAEEALRELNTTLESKVAQRTAELQHRARQLQKLTLELSETEDRERRQLAEILHDDLQQQLAAAKFHLSLLNSRAKHDPTQRAVVTQVDQMLMEAIQKSRNLSHELSPAVLYHADFTGALNWLAGQLHAKHGLEVAVDAFGEVNVESEALKTFLYKSAQELLFNVVKHARVNRARIRVRRFGRCICLSVSDRGRGFDPQELRQTAGFGLLSIRERIELLGGRMKIHSIKGHGSTFHIVIPDGPLVENGHPGQAGVGPHARPTSEAELGGHGGPPLRVLLADDHEIVREGLRSLLSDEHDVQVVGEAVNGREAVDQAYRLQPDVIIMDVAMPLINGDDATRQIKMHLPQTRVIALSMYEEPDMVEKMHRAGAEGYVLKTAPADELLAAIRGNAHAGATT